MKKFSILIIFLSVSMTTCRLIRRFNEIPKLNYVTRFLNIDDRVRNFHIHLPNNQVTIPNKLPLVVVLHGRFGTGIQVMEQTRFNDLADLNSFIVAYPDGYSRSWADGRGNTPSDREDVDDVNFIERMLSDLSQNFQIDIKRIFIVGHSNGGFMVQRMLLEKSDLFRGGVSVSSQLSVSLVKRFEPKSPVSMLMIAGTKDPLVPYYGGYVRDGGEILSAEDTLERWRKWNGCPESLVQATRNEVEDDTTLDILSYIGCQNNTTVKLYRINGGGHSWPGQDQKIPFVKMGPPTREIDAAKEIVLFFKELGL